MKRFHFRFIAVEKIRKSKEDNALNRLGGAQRALQNERSIKIGMLNQIEESLIRRELLAEKIASPTSYKLESDFIEGHKIRVQQQDQAIFRAQKSYEKALREYLFCRRQTRVIEKLKEKDIYDYKVQYRKWEQKQADDLNVMRSHLVLNNNLEKE